MDEMIGSAVSVTLKNNSVICGVLQSIVANSHMNLHNVYVPDTGLRWHSWSVQATAIQDLELLQRNSIPGLAPQHCVPDDGPMPAIPPNNVPRCPIHYPMNSQPAYQEPPHAAHHDCPHAAYQEPPRSPSPATRIAELPVHHSPVPQPAPSPPRHASAPFADPAIVCYGSGVPGPTAGPSRPSEAHTSAPSWPNDAPTAGPSRLHTAGPSRLSEPPTAGPVRLGEPQTAGPSRLSAPQTAGPSRLHTAGPSRLSEPPTAGPSRLQTVGPSRLSEPPTAGHSRLSEPGTSVTVMPDEAAAKPTLPFNADLAGANVAQQLATEATAPQAGLPSNPTVSLGGTTEDVGSLETGAQENFWRGQTAGQQTTGAAATGIAQEVADSPPMLIAGVSRNGNDMNGTFDRKGKGRCRSPFLPAHPQPVRPLDTAQQFAHGDTSDITGDFDFHANVNKVDEKQVFDQIRAGDSTAGTGRLGGHHRVAGPGIDGGNGLRPTGSFLLPKLDAKYNYQEPDSSSDGDTELNLASGQFPPEQSGSRPVFPNPRPGRGQAQSAGPHFVRASMLFGTGRKRSTASMITPGGPSGYLAPCPPPPDGRNSPFPAVSAWRAAVHEAAGQVPEPMFLIAPHMAPCATFFPGALEELEASVVRDFGLSHDLITENAGRAIAEAALELHRGMRHSRGSMAGSAPFGSPTEGSTVVVLAGNHGFGARALAAARHLLSRNVSVIAVKSLYETANSQDAQVRTQANIIRRLARPWGRASDVKRGSWAKSYEHIKNLNGPPIVIIDALLAGATYESLVTPNADFSANIQKDTREMIDWANRSRAPVLSVGCPSGLSHVDGTSTVIDGEPLAIRPNRVLALGAPFHGLLRAVENGELGMAHAIGVADIGINVALNSDEAVRFGTHWEVALQYAGGGA